jgi:GNAT superfamily N-acetyltransferase
MEVTIRRYIHAPCSGVYTLNVRHPHGFAEGFVITDKDDIIEASDFEQASYDAVCYAKCMLPTVKSVAYLHNLFVSKEYRGNGIGKGIVDTFVKSASNDSFGYYRGVEIINLFAMTEQEKYRNKLNKFYKKCGFMMIPDNDNFRPYHYRIVP